MRILTSTRVDGDEASLRAQARSEADRKLVRFLDAVSYAPFVATAQAFAALDGTDPAGVGLYTVSSWDGDMPDQPFVPEDADDDVRLSRHILEEANPVTWLRMLSNNPLCQVSIAKGFRGPNAHFVGGLAALRHALAAADDDLTSRAAQVALVVAYETSPEHVHEPSARALTHAVAVAFGTGDDVLEMQATAPDGVTSTDALWSLADSARRPETLP
jgi:3-oxoacyl-(acyl-carrier-protein) synthase